MRTMEQTAQVANVFAGPIDASRGQLDMIAHDQHQVGA
jgi:hypothetical protein